MKHLDRIVELQNEAHNKLLLAKRIADDHDITFEFTFPWNGDLKYREKKIKKNKLYELTADALRSEGENHLDEVAKVLESTMWDADEEESWTYWVMD